MKNRIAEIRIAAGLSQIQLAKLSGFPRRTLQMWENQHTVPDMYKAYQLSKTLGCAVEDLIIQENQEDNM